MHDVVTLRTCSSKPYRHLMVPFADIYFIEHRYLQSLNIGKPKRGLTFKDIGGFRGFGTPEVHIAASN